MKKMGVHRLIARKKLDASGKKKTVTRLTNPGTPKIRKRALIAKVKKAVTGKNPKTQRTVARNLKVSVSTVNRVIHQDLHGILRKEYQEGAQCGHTVFGQNSGHTVCSNYPTVCAQHRPIKPSPRNSRLTLLLRLPTGALTRVKINNIDNRGSADILSFLPSLLPIFRCFFCFLRMNAKDLAAAAVELNS